MFSVKIKHSKKSASRSPLGVGVKFYSTNKKSGKVSLDTAIFRGLAPDGGLYMPERIPKLPKSFFKRLRNLSFQEIALEVAKALIGADVPQKDLRRIIKRAINFPAPLVPLDKNTFILELFHGPTLSFKDFGARFMAELLSYFARSSKKEIVILTATSGDTGSAVAQGFYGVPNIKVVVLYPRNKVTKIQESQMSTLGKNITALEVRGTFDDCQKLVKQAFLNKELNARLNLTSANSINIARLIPQTFYYFWAYAQLQRVMGQGSWVKGQGPIVFSVPSGNFGNLTAGLIAKRMGLPVKRFIAATNVNSVVPEYLKSGKFRPRASKQTFSNAMDVGNPSNFARILDLHDHNVKRVRHDIWGASFSDKQTLAAIREVYEKYSYILEPHGAVGFLGLEKYRRDDKQNTAGIILETAHPAKFPEAVEKITRARTPMPARLRKFLSKKKKSRAIENDFLALKRVLFRLDD